MNCIELDGNKYCDLQKTYGGNHLHGSLPNLRLPFLELLFMSSNQLSGPIPSLEGMPELLTLELSTCLKAYELNNEKSNPGNDFDRTKHG